MEIEKLMTPAQIAEVLGFRRSKVYQMLAAGELPAMIISKGARRRVFRVRPSTLQKWMADREVKNGR